MSHQTEPGSEPEQMSEFESLEFASDLDLFFDRYFSKIEDGTIPIERAERFFEGLGCTPDPDATIDN